MTTEQELHLLQLKNEMLERMDFRYRRGQREHGGNLWDKNMNFLEEAIEENIDALVYLLTAIQQTKAAKALNSHPTSGPPQSSQEASGPSQSPVL